MTAAVRRMAIAGAVLLVAGLLLWAMAARVERPLAAALHLTRDGSWVPAVVTVTDLGGMTGMVPLALGVAIWLAMRGRRGAALWLVATIASGRLAVELLKLLVHRARPALAGQLVTVGSSSFPSAHSAGSMLTVAAILVATRAPVRVAAVALAWPVLIGLTRVLLGVHWPSDVLAGWGVALLWTAAATHWAPR